MVIIPLQTVPSQSLTVMLGGQTCQITISQKNTGVFVDLYINNTLILAGVIARNLVRIVRDLYFGFAGDLLFIDIEGNTDPVYTGFGTRYFLAYLEASELPPDTG